MFRFFTDWPLRAALLGDRLMVGQQVLALPMGVSSPSPPASSRPALVGISSIARLEGSIEHCVNQLLFRNQRSWIGRATMCKTKIQHCIDNLV